MNTGFFIAQKQEDGTPGRPLGNDEGAIMMFEELDVARRVRDSMPAELGQLSVFQVNISFSGEVIA